MIHVRPALPEDASRMVEVMERAFEPTFGEAWNAAQLVSALSQPESFGELAIAKSSAVAFTLARLISTEAELLLVAVSPEYRRQGVARRLLENVASAARTQGGRAIFLEVRAGNEPAVQLYKSAGFNEVGRRPAYYAGANQSRYDALTMRQSL